MPHTWDPDRYLAYADERGRPFVDLIARIDAESPRRVVDLGCGPGNLTGLLAQRWPDADVLGLDSSPEMIATGAGAGRPLRGRRPAGVGGGRAGAGRRTGLERDAAVGPGPPRAAAPAGRAGEPGRLVRLPGARQLRRAQPHDPSGPGRRGAVRRAHRRRGGARQPRPGDVSRGPGRGRLHRRRLGDDLPPRADRRRPGVHLGVWHRRPAHARGAAGRAARGVRGGVQGAAARGVPAPRVRRRAAVPAGLRGGEGRSAA